jgi:hypothetical protein
MSPEDKINPTATTTAENLPAYNLNVGDTEFGKM